MIGLEMMDLVVMQHVMIIMNALNPSKLHGGYREILIVGAIIQIRLKKTLEFFA